MSDGLTIRMLRQIQDFFFWANSKSQRKNCPHFQRFGFSFWKNCSKVLVLVPVLNDPELAFFENRVAQELVPFLEEPVLAIWENLVVQKLVPDLEEPALPFLKKFHVQQVVSRFEWSCSSISRGFSTARMGPTFLQANFSFFGAISCSKIGPQFKWSWSSMFWAALGEKHSAYAKFCKQQLHRQGTLWCVWAQLPWIR